MFKKIFGSKNKKEKSETLIIIQLNDKIMPMDRGVLYEEPLDEFLRSNRYGEITGGGTMQAESGEIEFCDMEVLIYKGNDYRSIIGEIILKLEDLGAPKRSHVILENTEECIAFGKKEGLAIYLDSVNLPERVYAQCDLNVVLTELSRLIGYDGEVERYWQGTTETAFYFYGDSFEDMKNAIWSLTELYPLCQNTRIVQIA
ncbi:hypothetical protein ACFQI7_03275 [Paenibacillus allorhizosphaerae]|uniref:DUF4265 domain-containing protein n=1 Tax=Paenibacillus allorhizosphaerae TaxID=2849866 RepID=A0ABN7TGQ3_9BACL|nr:hypothetical protein [Paenibacillus allorhizosphaerae]CAG7619418.1 hypothetical protein PAECIP111802_00616 [Paenibacillus allorhizosphaerae]